MAAPHKIPKSPALVLPLATFSLLSIAAAHLHPPSNSSSVSLLDHWISANLLDFHSRTQEIASGINTGLDPALLLAERNPRVITVSQDGRGDFTNISAAVASIPDRNKRRTVIRIGSGVYREKVRINRRKPFVTFSGHPDAMPTITFDDTAAELGTIDSATVIVESHYFIASNIIFENTAPRPAMGAKGAQAVAMRISGDKAAFYGCRFLGFQDTLCDDKGRHLFKDCFIQGTVDFIFGNGRSIYLRCEINSVADGTTYITAQARTKIADKSGFAFVHCRVTGTGSAYLSRAWKKSSRVVFAYTYMGSLVNPRGWDDKGFPDRQRTVFYGEYKCMGPGAATNHRVHYVKLLTDEQVKPYMSLTFVRGKTWLLPHPKL